MSTCIADSHAACGIFATGRDIHNGILAVVGGDILACFGEHSDVCGNGDGSEFFDTSFVFGDCNFAGCEQVGFEAIVDFDVFTLVFFGHAGVHGVLTDSSPLCIGLVVGVPKALIKAVSFAGFGGWIVGGLKLVKSVRADDVDLFCGQVFEEKRSVDFDFDDVGVSLVIGVGFVVGVGLSVFGVGLGVFGVGLSVIRVGFSITGIGNDADVLIVAVIVGFIIVAACGQSGEGKYK